MKDKKEIKEEIAKVTFDMDNTQKYDLYKYYEGVLAGLKWVLEDFKRMCPECKSKMVEYGLPSDDSGNVRMLCPNCGNWEWKD